MSKLIINANSIYDRIIRIGRQTENLVSSITFNLNMWVEEYGQGECVLNVRRNGDGSAYPVPMTIIDGTATWTITDTDTARKGRGEIQLKYTVGEKVKTSPIFTISCGESLVGDGEPPSGYEDWLTELGEMTAQVEAAKTSASASAASAAESATAAESAQTAAEAAQSAAETAQGKAETAQAEAEAAKTNAQLQAYNARESARSAELAKQVAVNSASTATTKATQATQSATASATSASESAESATASANSASEASTSATSASESAQSASTSATTAQNASASASQSATNASVSASQASASATSASTSASNAQTSAANASTSATQASESATQASTSATNASASASLAQEYAEQAEESAEALSDINERLQRQQGIIAEAFSAQSTYNVGDSVIYEAGLYTFKANKTAGSWDATKVDGPFKVTDQISSLKSELTQKPMQYRGRILDDGRTSCAECTDVGYYIFTSADVENITDFPQTDFTETGKQSGVLFVYQTAVGTLTQLYQRIEDYIGRTWYRNGTNTSWKTNITDDLGIRTYVTISQKGVTDAIQNLAYRNGMLNNCIKQASGSGGQRLTFAFTANAGDTVFYGVTGASGDTINYINAQYITSGGTKTAFDSNVQIGQKKNYNLPVDIVGVELYLNATGSTSISGYAIKDDTLIGEVLFNGKLLVDMNTMFATTKTNNGSAIITGISPIEHYVKLEFSQKNLLNPVCTQKLNFGGSSSTGYTLVSSSVKMANIVQLNDLKSVTISGDLTGFGYRVFRYVFTNTYPEAGTPVIASGAIRAGTITVPTGAKYLVWITGSQNITSISSEAMLNGGNNAESYVPYVSSFNLVVADDSSLTNSVTYSIPNANEPFYVKSRFPQMYVRAVASETITIKQTWNLNPVDVINIGNGMDSLTIGRGQTKVKDKYLCIAVGGNNLSESTEGMKNITVGFDNMYQTSGSRNTSIGYHALFRNTTANDGTAIGAEALDDNTSGNNNTACGAYALQRNAKGSNNAAVGFRALNGTAQHNVFDANAEYNGNTAIGVMAMENKGSGNNNTAIGYQSMSSQNNVNGCIALGYNAQCEKDNQMMLGGSNITEVVMCGNKKINFNADGTVTWETLT